MHDICQSIPGFPRNLDFRNKTKFLTMPMYEPMSLCMSTAVALNRDFTDSLKFKLANCQVSNQSQWPAISKFRLALLQYFDLPGKRCNSRVSLSIRVLQKVRSRSRRSRKKLGAGARPALLKMMYLTLFYICINFDSKMTNFLIDFTSS